MDRCESERYNCMRSEPVVDQTPNGAVVEDGDDIMWRCRHCVPQEQATLLAYIDEAGTKVRIKIKDVYIWIGFPTVGVSTLKMTCRKCGKINEL